MIEVIKVKFYILYYYYSTKSKMLVIEKTVPYFLPKLFLQVLGECIGACVQCLVKSQGWIFCYRSWHIFKNNLKTKISKSTESKMLMIEKTVPYFLLKIFLQVLGECIGACVQCLVKSQGWVFCYRSWQIIINSKFQISKISKITKFQLEAINSTSIDQEAASNHLTRSTTL